MYNGSDRIQSGIHPNITRSLVEINKLKSKAIWVISAIFIVAFVLISFTWIDNTQTHSLNYTFTSTTSHILKTYVRFTGTQFLIINRNQFDWTNVRIAIGLDRIQDHPLHEKIDPSAFMLMAPRIKSGEAYSTGIMQFRREDGTKLDPAITRPENIKIWSDTPRGRGFWYGSVADVTVVSHDQPPL